MDQKPHFVEYRIEENNILGRFMVANKDVKEGEIILKEKPALIGSTIKATHICFKCLRHLRTNFQICDVCNIALLCSKICTGIFHNEEECLALKTTNLKPKNLIENPQIVLPIRILLLKQYNEKLWDRFNQLKPHLNERKNTWIWRSHKYNVEQILQEVGFINKKEVDEGIIQKICGILDVNSFEVRPKGFQGQINVNTSFCLRAVYLEAALMSHDCVGNTHVATDDEFNITIRANRAISEGEPIFFNYSNVLVGTYERRVHLKEGKYFHCNCKRCSDPTELGTEISSLKCRLCRKGIIRLAIDSWKCSFCKHEFRQSLINSTVSEARRLIETLDFTNVVDPEKLTQKLLLTFHQNHYLILEIEQNLIAVYTQSIPNATNLKRKIKLCRHQLEVLGIIEPGISRHQAITMYELQSAEVSLAKLQVDKREIFEDEFMDRITSAEEILKIAIKYLLYEPANSPEGRLAHVALKELALLRNDLKIAENKCNKMKNRKIKEEIKKQKIVV